MENHLTKKIEQARMDVDLANNGYADIGTDEAVAKAMIGLGYIVITTKDLHSRTVNRAFKKKAQDCLKLSEFGQSTYFSGSKNVLPVTAVCAEELLLSQAEEITIDN